MRRGALLVQGFLCGLFVLPLFAGEGRDGGGGSPPGDTGGEALPREPGGAAGEAGEPGSGGASGGVTKPAGTATAAGYIYKQIEKGNVKIQGATDAEIPVR